jgi:hypothetical protein
MEATELLTFSRALPGAFMYPLRRSGAVKLGSVVVFYAALGLFPPLLAWALAVPMLLYCAVFLYSVLLGSTYGEDLLPDWPEPPGLDSLYVRPLLQWAAAGTACYLPALAFYNLVPCNHIVTELILLVLVGTGTVYLPMALLAMARAETAWVLAPDILTSLIGRVTRPYLVVLAILLPVLVFDPGIASAIGRLQNPGAGLAGHHEEFVRACYEYFLNNPTPGAFILRGAVVLLCLYLLVVAMRVLGLVYYFHQDRFPELERPAAEE